MLSDGEICDICSTTYQNIPEYWDNLWSGGGDTDDIYIGLKKIDGFDIVSFRGSITPQDWFRDFNAVIYDHPKLGGVERGFSEGIDRAYAQVIPHISQPIILTGHSLGAARSLIFGGLCAANNIEPVCIVTFGSPRPGSGRLSSILNSIPIRSYKNRYDPVTDVPGWLWPFLTYIHPRSLIPINVEPPEDQWDPLADHHIALYQAGTPRTKK